MSDPILAKVEKEELTKQKPSPGTIASLGDDAFGVEVGLRIHRVAVAAWARERCASPGISSCTRNIARNGIEHGKAVAAPRAGEPAPK